MLWKLIMLPFWIVRQILGLFGNTAKMGFILLFRMGRFFFRRTFGVLFGVAAGLLLGYRHLRIKTFTGRRHS
jgi:hypothetical protein